MRRFYSVILLVFLAALTIGCTVQPDNSSDLSKKAMSGAIAPSAAFSSGDYADAFVKSIEFYDANKCGPDVGLDNIFNWRGACHTTDGSDVSTDLTGGYHDAGDHVKFMITINYMTSIMGWAMYDYPQAFEKTGIKAKFLRTMKYATDFMIKSHPNANTYYYQVADGDQDHTYWGAPELQTGPRATIYNVSAANPAADICGHSAAALVLMYYNYQSVDQAYANKCLQTAIDLYALGKKYLGAGKQQAFYKSSSWGDDFAWGALWLYRATGDSSYLTDAEYYVTLKNDYGDDPFKNRWTMCWDTVSQAVMLELYKITGAQKYKDSMDYNMNYWLNSLTKTPGGLRFLHNWGVLRYAAAASFLALEYGAITGDSALNNFGYSQVEYIMGANPPKFSYIIGFDKISSSWCLHPHHRAANGYSYANGDNLKPAKYLLTGALVGGPDQSDVFMDDGSQYQYTEVAIDYNASLVAALAAIVQGGNFSSKSSSSKSSVSTSSIVSSLSVSSKSSVSSSSLKVSSSSSTSSKVSSSSSKDNINPLIVPGKIEAENYSGMSGIQTESCSEGTLNVGWIDAGDWFEYFVDVQTAGSYDVEYRVASQFASGKCDMIVGGTTLASTVIPNTGGWQTWTTVTASVNLAKGTQVIRLYASGELWNINWINLKLKSSSSSSKSSINSSVSSKSSSSVISSKSSSSIASSSSISSAVSSASSSSSSSGGQYVDKTAPFAFDGAGEYFWKMSSIPSYINSWNLDILDINGVSFLNKWAPAAQLPAKQDGYYYIRYKAAFTWSHFEAK